VLANSLLMSPMHDFFREVWNGTQTIKFSDAMLSDINVVLRYVLSQYRRSNWACYQLSQPSL
jgi:hypothetical protein